MNSNVEVPTFLHANIVMLVFLHDVSHFLFHFMKILRLSYVKFGLVPLSYLSRWWFSTIKCEVMDISHRTILAVVSEDMENPYENGIISIVQMKIWAPLFLIK